MDTPACTTPVESRWRPALHFTAKRGFINDPNGLIYIDGHHHAFYQHNPHDVVHGPMHWGHAVSDDLVHWQELPIALYPDKRGQCFSGSAVPMPDDSVALIYTAHLEKTEGEALQTQCLVYANRELTHFESEPGNPVLNNQSSLKDFRDPKVFWHAATASWIMLITHGRHVGIYRSDDLLDWTFSSEFGAGLGAHGEGAWECPDLVEVPMSDGETRWVLIVGVWSGACGGGSGTQYFIGEFDGFRYHHDVNAASIHWFDYGRDCYAVQSFAGRDAMPPRVIAWFSNWQYANETPTQGFRGSFTLPRDLELVDTSAGYRLRQRVPDTVRNEFTLINANRKPESAVYRIQRQESLKPGQCLEFCLFGETEPVFTIKRHSANRSWNLIFDRKSTLGNNTTLTTFASTNAVELTAPPGDTLEYELFVDHGLTELFISGGIDVATMCFYPADPSGKVSVTQHDEK
ncbi:MAG: glycoside hydrolase family 32 protein [Granulosicoccus sp.]